VLGNVLEDQLISPDAQIGTGNKFGRGVIIDAGVTLDDNRIIRNYAVLTGRTEIGNGNHIGSHGTIGEIPTHTRGKFEFVEQDASVRQRGTPIRTVYRVYAPSTV
jgi:UDP-N-acetylglucosamine acyltransferase